MDRLSSILQKWNHEKDVESLIAQDLFADQNAIQSELDKLPDPLKTEALSTLGEIQSALQNYIVQIDSEKQDIKAQIDNNIKSKNACLSYGSSIDIEKRRHDE